MYVEYSTIRKPCSPPYPLIAHIVHREATVNSRHLTFLSSPTPRPALIFANSETSVRQTAKCFRLWISTFSFLETSPFLSLCSFMYFLYCLSFGHIAVWLVTRIRFGAHQFSEQQIDFDFWPLSIVGDMQDNVTQSKIAAQCFWEQQVASLYDTWWWF